MEGTGIEPGDLRRSAFSSLRPTVWMQPTSQQQIDNGFASETTRAGERTIADRRRKLHQRIDALRESLGLPTGPRRAPDRGRLALAPARGLM